MTNEPTVRESSPAEPGERDAVETDRRVFLGAAARKVLYVAPVVVAISASRAFGSNPFFSFCGDVGSPCTTDADCCTGTVCQLFGESMMAGFCMDIGV